MPPHPRAPSPGGPVALPPGARESAGGFAWLDSATADHGSISLVASPPLDVFKGSIWRDADRLRAIIAQEGHRHPDGGLVGWVGFDGDYTFGLFAHCNVLQHPCISCEGDPRSVFDFPTLRPSENPDDTPLHFEPQMDEQTFCRLVRRAQEYIAAGDIYQVNLSYPWLAPWPDGLNPLDFYLRLRSASPAPYGAFMDLGGTQVFSASPECFLEMEDRRIITRPIKGTRPRGATPEQDACLARELAASPKERAELVMITDLERNDLGQVCEFGSVRVTGLLKLERYAQVQHLVSTVEGTLRQEIDHLGALIACFPGGSISGAPKKRALEIIRELEPHDRGLYTGAIGYLGFNGASRFSVAIRTAWREGGAIRFDTGAGIVADSDPVREWEETRHKAQGLLRAAASFA